MMAVRLEERKAVNIRVIGDDCRQESDNLRLPHFAGGLASAHYRSAIHIPHAFIMKTLNLLILIESMLAAAPLVAQTNILDEFGGKRILYVDHQNIRPDPNGDRLLFVDGDNIRPDPTGKTPAFHRP